MGIKRSRIKLPFKEYKALIIKVFERDGWKCKVPLCKKRENLHAHHILFRSHGGDDASYNLVTMCHDCHEALHHRFILIEALIDVSKPAEGQYIDADFGLVWKFLAGWTPGKKITHA